MPPETETAPISPQALRYAREQLRISQRELGRRVARHIDRSPAAIRMQLSKIERGDEVSEEDRELLDALAAELAVGVGDLAEPPLWVWIMLAGGRPGVVELAMRLPVYSTPELAYQARDWLAHASDGDFTPFQGGQLVPMRRGTVVEDVLDANYPDLTEEERRMLIVVDPDNDSVLPNLAGLNRYMNTKNPRGLKLDMIVAAVDEFGLLAEVIHLHDLALRRLTKAPAGDAELLESWRLREQRLYELLERHRQLWLERRGKALASVGT